MHFRQGAQSFSGSMSLYPLSRCRACIDFAGPPPVANRPSSATSKHSQLIIGVMFVIWRGVMFVILPVELPGICALPGNMSAFI
eukprot:scaffold9836_cov37-Prasinocladus_malaysianus.AAC.1